MTKTVRRCVQMQQIADEPIDHPLSWHRTDILPLNDKEGVQVLFADAENIRNLIDQYRDFMNKVQQEEGDLNLKEFLIKLKNQNPEVMKAIKKLAREARQNTKKTLTA